MNDFFSLSPSSRQFAMLDFPNQVPWTIFQIENHANDVCQSVNDFVFGHFFDDFEWMRFTVRGKSAQMRCKKKERVGAVFDEEYLKLPRFNCVCIQFN